MTTTPHVGSTTNWKSRIIALLIAFLLGLIPMWMLAYSRGSAADKATIDLRTAALKNQIAAATLYGKRGEYEKSRQFASEFFTSLKTRMETVDAGNSDRRTQLSKLLDQRDQIVTLLARSDPAGVDRLFEIQYQTIQILPSE
jgi:hypothetical protein